MKLGRPRDFASLLLRRGKDCGGEDQTFFSILRSASLLAGVDNSSEGKRGPIWVALRDNPSLFFPRTQMSIQGRLRVENI